MSAPLAAAVAEQPEQWLSRVSTMLEAACSIDAAARLGILDRLHETPATAVEIAQQCATAPEMTRLLLDALDALAVVQRSDDGKYATTAAAQWLTTLRAGWSRLDQVVRTGQPVVSADTPVGAAELYPDLVPLLSRLLSPAVRRATELLAPVHGEVLDVGAGAAPWSIALA
jgi:hypothetical protein